MTVRRYSALARRHHSFACSRGLRPFIVSCCQRTIVRCLESCAHRLFVVAWALSLIVCRHLCAVARVSSLVSRRLSSPVLRSFVVARALSLFVRLLTSIVILRCLSSPEVDRSFSLRVFVSCGCMTRVFEIWRSECRVFALFFL